MPAYYGGVGEVEEVASLALDWQSCFPAGSLAADEIHLWAMNLMPLQTADRMTLLTEDDRVHAARYANCQQRTRYLGGRIGIRLLLSAYTGISAKNLHFVHGKRGKPALSGDLPEGELCFNYTLSGDHALYALAWNRQVGVDMETFPRKINARGLAQRKLTADEHMIWSALPPAQREYGMLACWTRKEAYGKTMGVGIRYTMNEVPLFVGIDSPFWSCPVCGLFDMAPNGKTLHGVQLGLPFPGAAVLMYDGDALESPLAGASLKASQLLFN